MNPARFGICCEMHKVIEGQVHVTNHWVTATIADLDLGRIPVSMYPCESFSGVTADKVRDLVASQIGNFPNVKAVRVYSKEVRP